MKYKLSENYFQTDIFQQIFGEYFQTILPNIIAEKGIIDSKGLFVKEGKILYDGYDMPYHIHILTGLIPILLIYEKYFLEKNLINEANTPLYIKIFIMGFTFHDANKLLGTEQQGKKTDLEIAVELLPAFFEKIKAGEFLEDIKKYQNSIFHLILATEARTRLSAEAYQSLNHVRKVQVELCHIADALASIGFAKKDKQGEINQLVDIESFVLEVKKALKGLEKINEIHFEVPVSFIKIRQNPYILLSQQLLTQTKKYLGRTKVLYALRDGLVFWGNDLNGNDISTIRQNFIMGSADLKPLKLTDISADKCKFGFVGSLDFTPSVLQEIISEKQDDFLKLSPNNKGKITDFEGFVQMTDTLIEEYMLPLESNVLDNGSLSLKFFKNINDDDNQVTFRTLFNLHKIQWLQAKNVKKWREDFTLWEKKNEDLPNELIFGDIEIKTFDELRNFIRQRVNTTSALFKMYLNFIKTYIVWQDIELDIEQYIIDLQKDIIANATPDTEGEDEQTGNPKAGFFDRYYSYQNTNATVDFLKNYNPKTPSKSAVCAFTGDEGTVPYESAIAFGMKARGFSNRSVTTLKNTTSYISKLFAEENRLRGSQFEGKTDANLIVYHDFFESSLDINRDLIRAIVKAKSSILKFLDKNETEIEFDKNSKYQPNLFNLDFEAIPPDVEKTFYFIRRKLILAKHLGIRSAITGIMSSYTPHKAIFHFENPPQYIRLLGWNSIRLVELDSVREEINLMLTCGAKNLTRNVLRIAKSRRAYFRIFYELRSNDDRLKVENSLLKFYKQYKSKFENMEYVEKTVDLAIKIKWLNFDETSSSQETWLMRAAINFLRSYVKKEHSKTDIIQKMAAELDRKLDDRIPNREPKILAFCEAVYEQIYEKEWQKKLPPINIQKEVIYQFGFLYRIQSREARSKYSAAQSTPSV